MIQTRGSVLKLSAQKVHEREKDTKQRLEEQRKEGRQCFFLSQVTQRKAVRGQRGVLTITLAPCKGKPMSGMHTAIQVKSEEEQVPSTSFTREGDLSLFTKRTESRGAICLNPLYTHNETDKYQDPLLNEARLHS